MEYFSNKFPLVVALTETQEMALPKHRGVSRVKQDDKKRLALPARHRASYLAAFGEHWDRELVCALHYKLDCLVLWVPEEHDEFAADLETRGAFDEHVEMTQFRAVDHSADISIDKQWRMLIPQGLRDCADIGDEIVIVGRGTQVQIWDAAIYDEYFAMTRQRVKDMGAQPSAALRGKED